MIRSANHSSFPRVDESPLDQQVRLIKARQERGEQVDEELASAIDEVTTIIVAQQSRAFIDIVTDGMVRWDGPLSHLAGHLDGLQTAELYRWFGTNFYDRRVEVVGDVRHRGPFMVHDHEVTAGVALKQVVKAVLPGPVWFARWARDRHYGDVGKLARAMADALAAEVAALAAAGATCFQIDEPLLCSHPEDLELVVETAGTVFGAAGADAMTILSTHFGDLSAVGDRLAELPGTHLGLDLVSGEGNLPLLERLPERRGVVLGLFDARTTLQEDAADAAARLLPYRDSLTARDVVVGPNAGLELLPRDQAFDKLLHARYVVEKLSKEWTWAS